MPKLTLNGETITVTEDKVAVYQQQGWGSADAESTAPAEDGAAENVVKRPAKKAAKKAAKKS